MPDESQRVEVFLIIFRTMSSKNVIQGLVFKISNKKVKPLVGKVDSIMNSKTNTNVKCDALSIVSINTYLKVVPNFSSFCWPLRLLQNNSNYA